MAARCRAGSGGDFPAFYGAARIVADGEIADLYDVEVQTEAQADLWGPDDPGVLYFAYPPHVAAAYGPLASLSYPVAYALHTLMMSAFVLAALALAKPLLARASRRGGGSRSPRSRRSIRCSVPSRRARTPRSPSS